MKRIVVVASIVSGLLQPSLVAATRPQKRSTTTASVRRTTVRRKPAPPPVDPTLGDNIDGDDLTIRRAAVAALGGFAGSVVVVDPNTGRVLTMVNQKLALRTGFIPCSTVKLITSLAALSDNLITKNTSIYTSRYV